MKAYNFFKNVVSVLTAIAKAKKMAVKSKTSALKIRLLIFGFVRDKKVWTSAASHKNHMLMGKEKGEGAIGYEHHNKSIMLCNSFMNEISTSQTTCSSPMDLDSDDDCPDPEHLVIHSEDEDSEYELGDSWSVMDLIRKSQEDHISELELENDIDHIADVFIRRFHKQMWMQR